MKYDHENMFDSPDLTQPLLQLQTDTSFFVASAANQMLAHILLHFQPPLSAGCNGIEEEDEDDKRTCSSITAVAKETSVEYTAVVMAISEYLKESLIPKVNTQHYQSVQLLKLLALLLAQARPPLRDTLLRTATDSLKELVTGGCSQLMLPLMDVILAAHR